MVSLFKIHFGVSRNEMAQCAISFLETQKRKQRNVANYATRGDSIPMEELEDEEFDCLV